MPCRILAAAAAAAPHRCLHKPPGDDVKHCYPCQTAAKAGRALLTH